MGLTDMEDDLMGKAKYLLDTSRALLGEHETYKDVYDLTHLHSRVASVFALDPEYVPIIEKDIADCRDPVARASLERQRDILASGTRWKWFYKDTKEYIKTWIGREVTERDLSSSVRLYITTLKNYFSWISIVWESSITRTCRECNTPITGNQSCNRCGEEQENVKKVEKMKRSTAGSVDNFMRCIRSIMVNNCQPLPDSVSSSLDTFATSVGMYTGAEIRCMPLDADGHRGPYSIAILIQMLKATKNTDYYPEKWWVAKNYWGWDPYSIDTSAEEELKRDCSAVFSFYASECSEEGSINREWLAVRLLLNHREKLNRPLLLTEFDIIKTPDILEGYESRWSSFCEKNKSWNPCPIYGSWSISGR